MSFYCYEIRFSAWGCSHFYEKLQKKKTPSKTLNRKKIYRRVCRISILYTLKSLSFVRLYTFRLGLPKIVHTRKIGLFFFISLYIYIYNKIYIRSTDLARWHILTSGGPRVRFFCARSNGSRDIQWRSSAAGDRREQNSIRLCVYCLTVRNYKYSYV